MHSPHAVRRRTIFSGPRHQTVAYSSEACRRPQPTKRHCHTSPDGGFPVLKKTLATGAFALLACTALAGQASARDQIRIVGSSTVFPFSTAVAEQFAKTSSFKAPVVESTGTGGGMKLRSEEHTSEL